MFYILKIRNIETYEIENLNKATKPALKTWSVFNKDSVSFGKRWWNP